MKKTELFYFKRNDLMVSVVYDKAENMATYACHRKMEARETMLIETYIEMKILGTPRSIITYIGEDDVLQKTWDEFHSQNSDSEKSDDDLSTKTDFKQAIDKADDLMKKIHEDAEKIRDFLKGDDDLLKAIRDANLKGDIGDDFIVKKVHDKNPNKKELYANLQGFLLEGVNTKKIEELKKNADEGFCFDRIGDILRDRNENHSKEAEYRMEELEMYLKEFNKLTKSNITLNSLI